MIKVVSEPGGLADAERCAFCRKPTHTWYRAKDVAVCEDCARFANWNDVPDKRTWCRRERIAASGAVPRDTLPHHVE